MLQSPTNGLELISWSHADGVTGINPQDRPKACHRAEKTAGGSSLVRDIALRAGPRCFWQVYLDNYMAAEVGKIPSTGGSSVLQQHATKGWCTEGVLCASDKDVLEASHATELGVHFDSPEGLLGGGPIRVRSLMVATLMLLKERLPKVKWVQIILGRWIFILQFRRPGMAILSNSWDYTAEGGRAEKNWRKVQKELSSLLSVAPLLQTDLRAPFSDVVTCSDASQFGGAVAIAQGLTDQGQGMAQNLMEESLFPLEAELLVISAFNGVGGAFRCYDVIGIRPSGLIAIEWDRAAQRVNRKAWPRTIEYGDINSITKATVWEWSNMFPRVKRVHLVGGFPCVHLSSVRAGRKNLMGEGSKLFWKRKELITWTEAAFKGTAEVDFLVENVFSMDADARSEISSELGVEPLMLCPSDVLPYNRPRLAWCSLPVHQGEGVALEQLEGYVRVHMEAVPILDEQWIEPGWRRCDSSTPMATFMKAIPRSHPPPVPAGLRRCSESTVTRWVSDQYGFPPCQYAERNLLKDSHGNLRVCSPQERELLLGFGWNHTAFAYSASAQKSDATGYQDKRMSLCGDSFSILSFGWIVGQMCATLQSPPSPQMILDRLGLAPGCSLAAGVVSPIARKLQYGPLNRPRTLKELTAQISRFVNHTGSDVAISTGTLFNRKIQNHASLRADWWTWKILFCARWKFNNHINYLEMKMIVQALRWRSRSADAVGSRFLHLGDSMVCNYILSKGRTSSHLLQPLTREIAAHLLALGSQQFYGHVDSMENPTDHASRQTSNQEGENSG